MVNDPRDLEALVAHLEDLTEAFDADHTDEFLAHLSHTAPEVRAVAVRGLWESPDPGEVLEPLMRAAEQDPDEEVRATALSVMGRYIYEGLLIGDEDTGLSEIELDPSVVQQVRSYLEGVLNNASKPELLRRRALEALAFDPGPEEVELIEKWAASASPNLRMTAVFAMGRSELEQWETSILRALEDADYEVQREAIRATGEAHLLSGVSRLRRFIEGSDRDLMLEAIAALGAIGGDEAVDILLELADAEDEEVAEEAQDALEAAEEQDALRELEEDEFDDA